MKETVEEFLKRGGKINVIEYNEPEIKKELAEKFAKEYKRQKRKDR